MNYFTSDFHLGNDYIINLERNEFENIEQHDNFVMNLVKEWSNKLKQGDVWYNLGDWGNPEKMYIVNILRVKGIKTIFIKGNHDKDDVIKEAKKYFDEVYLYPIYLTNRLIVSHIPESVFKDQLNICGHIHGANLNSPNYLCCSLKVANYKMISEKHICAAIGKLPGINRKFLYEPYAEFYNYKGIDRNDIVYDPVTGDIDLSASRALQTILKHKEN